MNMNSSIHTERRDVNSPDYNRRMSISLLNSLMPALLDFATEKSNKSLVICCPSSNESNVVARMLSKHWLNTQHLERLFYKDLKPTRITDDPGVHVMCYANVIQNVVSCDIMVNYYPLDKTSVSGLYQRARTLALFDPMNKRANWYAQYIAELVDRKTGVRK